MDPQEALKQTVQDILGRIKAEARDAASDVAEYAAARARHAASRRSDPDIGEIVRLEAQNVKAYAIQQLVALADTADNAAWSALDGALGVAVRLI